MSTEAAIKLQDDSELVARFRDEQDHASFSELVRRHRNRVYALALLKVKHDEEALEIVHDTFLSPYRKLP